tara:strand:+ start:1523 stop:1999 length:477 start_codon:yes stop_codon:yes gene_type:complete
MAQKDTPSMAKNKMKRAFRAIIDPLPKEAEKKQLWDYFDSRCAYCDTSIERGSRKGHLDHAIPTSEGGTNSIHNHVLSCDICNGDEKRDTPWQDFLHQKAGAAAPTRERLIRKWLEQAPAALPPEMEKRASDIASQALDAFDAATEQLRNLRDNNAPQ